MSPMERARGWAIKAVGTFAAIALTASTYESFLGLHGWALSHSLSGAGGWAFPGVIDSFPLMGDAALFVAMHDGKPWQKKVAPWAVILLGLAVSIGFQVGDVHSADLWTRITHGLFPATEIGATLLGAQIFEAIMAPPPAAETEEDEEETDEEEETGDDPLLELACTTFAGDIAKGHVTGLGVIRKEGRVGHDKARIVQAHIRRLVDELEMPVLCRCSADECTARRRAKRTKLAAA